MEQNNLSRPIEPKAEPARKAPKKSDSFTVRFDKSFMKKVSRLVDRANKKPFGRKIRPRVILETLLGLADEKLLESVVKKAQEDSLSHNDKKEAFLKEKLSKFGGSKEQLELKMMALLNQHLSQNRT